MTDGTKEQPPQEAGMVDRMKAWSAKYWWVAPAVATGGALTVGTILVTKIISRIRKK